MSEKQRVVVTGMGVVSGLGFDPDTLWRHMITGTTGIRPIVSFDTTDYKTTNGCEVDSEALRAALKAESIRPLERSVDMALLAAGQALRQAGCLADPPAPQDIATLFGTGAGSTHGFLATYKGFIGKGLRGMRPTTVPRLMANVTSSHISMRYKLTGPNYVIVSACSSATVAMGNGFRMIRDGYANTVLTGGTDAIFDPASFGGWNNLGVMSQNPDPDRCCRPFDRDRDGCILGEGAVALLIDSLEHAQESGRIILGEIVGYGEASDAAHITTPNPDGQASAMRTALASAGISPGDIGFINAHGTATKTNDICESQSIRHVFGTETDRIPVASNKSYFGHTLGAAGALESLVTLQGLAARQVPANLNLDSPDPDCDLCLVGSSAQSVESPYAMSNSFGFGGNNTALVFKRWDS